MTCTKIFCVSELPEKKKRVVSTYRDTWECTHFCDLILVSFCDLRSQFMAQVQLGLVLPFFFHLVYFLDY